MTNEEFERLMAKISREEAGGPAASEPLTDDEYEDWLRARAELRVFKPKEHDDGGAQLPL